MWVGVIMPFAIVRLPSPRGSLKRLGPATISVEDKGAHRALNNRRLKQSMGRKASESGQRTSKEFQASPLYSTAWSASLHAVFLRHFPGLYLLRLVIRRKRGACRPLHDSELHGPEDELGQCQCEDIRR